ncbi:MAG TPA: DEAD/DEAH box helicase [Anaerolineaceae bacterium]|nr:DEAD/DEAH box helicase [Anaerolineaceae bacterium]HPN51894.1 DEAD/DEAH box helicase [Anaerolineaceae bacterium]
MSFTPQNPLVIQSDKTVLLEVQNDLYAEARDALARFAELEKSPEYLHTYRITPLSLWNAAASGLAAEEIIAALQQYAKYDVPSNVVIDIRDTISRFGRLKLSKQDEHLLLSSEDAALMEEISRHKQIGPLLKERVDAHSALVDPALRGHIKQALIAFGFPAEDLAGYTDGAVLPFQLRAHTLTGHDFGLRPYQQESVDVFHAGGTARGGSGVIVLPCGAGKTIVGMGVMSALQTHTLILTPSTVAARQWIDELLDKTTLTEDQIGEYTGLSKQVRPVTISTYQIITYRKRGTSSYPHFALFNQGNWGLIIYDEVHLLPAPVFRITADLQARRRLGLTATLVREDRRETDVFTLIGPKKHDIPWKAMEKQGWIAEAECYEVRVPLREEDRMEYAITSEDLKYRFAAENPRKFEMLDQVIAKHPEDNILIIGMYLSQLSAVAERYQAPLITGETPIVERQKLFERFRSGEVRLLVVSKVANFAIDLPDANVAIQISGTFGSRQEEAQRLGRILRPKRNGLLAHFYSIVTRDTRDQDFAANRQMFLTEQGYRYNIIYDYELPGFHPATLSGQVREITPSLLEDGRAPA